MSAYSDKLKDPRWQKKRLRILKRDKWTCKICGSKDKTLCVHHLAYDRNKEPWETNNKYLITLCDQCHESEPETKSQILDSIVYMLKQHLSSDLKILEGVIYEFQVAYDFGHLPQYKNDSIKSLILYIKEDFNG